MIYRTVVIDPPWPVKKIKRQAYDWQGDDAMPYQTMSLEAIYNFDTPAFFHHEGAHVFVWTTHKYLPATFAILDRWGVTYYCTFTWRKTTKHGHSDGMKPFGWPKLNSEFVVYGRFRNIAFLETKGLWSCFDGLRREHSRKPDVFYDTVTRCCEGPRIDIFSRQQRDGWDVFGDQCDLFPIGQSTLTLDMGSDNDEEFCDA